MSAALDTVARFVASADVPESARLRAATAVMDTIGVALAGAFEPAARAVRATISARRHPPDDAAARPDAPCSMWGAGAHAAAADAALANGTAAHALDFDDMCFVSLAHPSAPLVPAIMAAAELAGASGRALLDAYAAGFEVQARFGRLMNPRHYQRGWHCTSTLGVLSAAAGASRLLGLDAAVTAHVLGIAASMASGLKENFGSMVKPLHAGLAARDGVTAALLARSGLTASANALDGPQGYLHALDSESEDLSPQVADLGRRWEILDTGITVKLYPSCAGTHPTLDALFDLRAEHGFTADDVDRVDIDVDPIVPTILIHDRSASALEAKFSMPFCAAAALVLGRVDIATFDEETIRDDRIAAMIARVSMRVDPGIGAGRPALTESRVRVRLKDGRELVREAHGARGYPEHPASQAELEAKFIACATRAFPEPRARQLLSMLAGLDTLEDVRTLLDERKTSARPAGRRNMS
jgi:2-methylcitrate dehydratase PrpD